jgi:riboflavin kinase/FMN adenylyltransferase
VEVLRGPQHSFYLSTPEEKADLVAPFGLDALVTQPFSQAFSKTTAREFVDLLVPHLDLQQLWVGQDFALGHNREGDVPTLRRFGETLGFQVQVVEPVGAEGGPISSSRIRQLLAAGEVAAAAGLLGRPYALTGEVEKGAGRGRSIGIPTANLKIWPQRAVPGPGVYAGWAAVAGRRWGAVTNIGVRPTFDDKLEAPVVETHILDYDGGDFYGQELRLEFHARLRDEQRFDGVEALVAQIQADIQNARQILGKAAETA